MDTVWQDVRYGVRLLAKSPGFTTVAVLTLALGISANTTVFSWVESVLLNPFPGARQSHRLVTLETVTPSGEFIDSSWPDYRDYRDRARTLSGIFALEDRPLTLGDDREGEWLWGGMVSDNFFDVLGVEPALGQLFHPNNQEEKRGAYPVAVITHGLWTRRYNADPAIIGRTVRVNQQPLVVIGVAEKKFSGVFFGISLDVWLPLMMAEPLTGSAGWLDNRESRSLHLLARLQDGVTLEQARAEIKTIATQLQQAFPDSNQGISAELLPLWQAPYGAQSVLLGLLALLMAVSIIVLIIAGANVANLLLARATGRQKEISIRLAVGAGRARLIRMLLTESLLLALLAGAVGTLLAVWMVDLLWFFVPDTELPIALDTGLNLPVLGFTLLVCLGSGVVFGLAPALQSARLDLVESLKEGGRTSGTGTRSRLRGLLVVAEVALALVTLVGAGLFIQSFQRTQRINPGFDPKNVLLAGLNLSASGYDRAQGIEFYERLLERAARLPGVEVAALAEDVPLGFAGGSWEDIEVEGYVPRPDENMRIYRNIVAPDYFTVMRIRLLQGRDFTLHDDPEAAPVVIVNETFLRRFLPNQNPLGKRIRGWGEWLTVVGVVADIKYQALREKPLPYMYVPFRQFYRIDTGIGLHLRTAGPPEALVPTVRQLVRDLDPDVSIFAATSVERYIAAAVFAQRIAASLLTALGGLALLLAALGLYSVMAYSVSQRTHEVGIRMALGAQPRDIFRLVVKNGMALTAVGLALGLLTCLVVARLLTSMLYGVSPTDPLTLAGIALLLAATALLACYLPARRAARVDPMVALRYE